MNTGSNNLNDGFHELMQTQKLQELPSFLESTIMQKIEAQQLAKPSAIKIKSIFIFGLLLSLYVLLSFIHSYYFPHSAFLQDCKTLAILSIIIQVVYELNEAIPSLIFKNKHIQHSHN